MANKCSFANNLIALSRDTISGGIDTSSRAIRPLASTIVVINTSDVSTTSLLDRILGCNHNIMSHFQCWQCLFQWTLSFHWRLKNYNTTSRIYFGRRMLIRVSPLYWQEGLGWSKVILCCGLRGQWKSPCLYLRADINWVF